jgi:cytochrome c1
MCECGCGELRPLAKIRGDGGWHFIEVYPGCTNCGDVSWALGATWVADDDEMLADGWLLRDTPTVEYDRHGQWGRPLLNAAILKRLFVEDGGGEDDDFSDAFSEFMDQGGLIRAQSESLRAALATEGGSDDA